MSGKLILRLSVLALTVCANSMAQSLAAGAPQAVTSYAVDPQARALAEKIAAHASSLASVSLTMNNLSSLPAQQAEARRSAVESQLRAAGVEIVDRSRALSDVHLTVSENPRGLLWVAQIRYGAAEQVVFQEEPRPAAFTSVQASTFEIVKLPLCSSHEPLLDAVQLSVTTAAVSANAPLTSSSSQALLLLSAGKVMLASSHNGICEIQQTAPVQLNAPWPRDPRGKILLSDAGSFELFLPGTTCSGNTIPLLQVSCHASDAPWPLAGQGGALRATFASDANYFDGRLFSAISGAQVSTVPPFFSAAYLSTSQGNQWWFTGTDSRARAYTPGNTVNVDTWGSDIAPVFADCDRETRLLVSAPTGSQLGGAATVNSIRLLAMRNGQPIDTGAVAAFDGVLTALWSAADQRSAAAVVRLGASNTYEAFGLSVRCRR
jgi:hypothetical protein